ncbi:MAG: Type III pantothenate kinase [Planctomycetes bacterium ADurb.Bin401]|nr:MAG: Type III pantothenate kinase [Planctomycetes bacterium ADurb.Bin401]
MNLIAIDIGNTNITAGLFLEDIEAGIEKTSGDKPDELAEVLSNFWSRVPFVKAKEAKDKKRDARIVIASVNPKWTELVKNIVQEKLGEKALEVGIGKDIPLPMGLDVDKPEQVGVDRVMAAFAAYCVVEDAIIVADFGTAVTIDAVSEKGIYLGGMILPGFDISSEALHRHTALLPQIGKVKAPQKPYGRNTEEAINNGLYYAAIGALETITRIYSEQIGKWPQTIVTGGNMDIIKSGCDFVDNFVDDLVVKGIVLSFKKHIGEKA